MQKDQNWLLPASVVEIDSLIAVVIVAGGLPDCY